MLLHDIDKSADVIALEEASQFGHHCFPGHGYDSGLNHSLHPPFVGVLAGSARCIGDGIHLVAFADQV